MPPGSTRSRASSAVVGALRLRSISGQLVTLVLVKAAVVLAAMTLLIVTVVQADAAGARTRTLNQGRADIARAIAHLAGQQTGLRGYLISGDRQFLAPLVAGQAGLQQDLVSLREKLQAVDESTAAVDAFGVSYRAWFDQQARPEIALADAGRLDEARAAESDPARQILFSTPVDRAVAIAGTLTATYQSALAESTGLRSRVVWLVVGVLVMLVGALLLASAIVRYAVLRPLAAMRRVARRVAEGAWEDVVEVRGPAETRSLAADVDTMRLALLQGVESERRAAEALDQNGPAVVALRRALQPAPAEPVGVEVAGRLDPVEGVLAGDWWEVFEIDDRRVAVVLGDVAGHGARSGVYALRLKGLLRSSLTAGSSPAVALRDLARHVARFPDDDRVASGELFATVFTAVVDRDAGELVYASAGHLDAVLMRALPRPGTSPVHYDQIDLPPTGPMLSTLLADRSWADRRHRFDHDDVVLAVTDGVLEARDRGGVDEFGSVRLVRRLTERLVAGDSAADVVHRLFDDVAGFERRARDDRTMVMLRHVVAHTRFVPPRLTVTLPIRPH